MGAFKTAMVGGALSLAPGASSNVTVVMPQALVSAALLTPGTYTVHIWAEAPINYYIRKRDRNIRVHDYADNKCDSIQRSNNIYDCLMRKIK